MLSTYLESNINKEADKDRLIIEHAAEALASGKEPGDVDIDEIFEKTKAIDQAFVRRLLIPSFSVKIRYEDIADIRKKRIALLSATTGEVLRKWEGSSSFSAAVRNTYTESRFREIFLEVLHLYNLETRNLTNSIKFFSPFNRAIGAFAVTMFETMEAVAAVMVEEYADKVFRGDCECVERT